MLANDISLGKAFKDVNEIKEHFVPVFSRFNRLSLNTVKTEFMIIGTPNSICNLDKDPGGTPYLIVGDGNCRIRRMKLVKSLGLIVDDALKWSNHIYYTSGKVKRGVSIKKKTSKYLDKSSLLMLYKMLVETYFRYCNVIWGSVMRH